MGQAQLLRFLWGFQYLRQLLAGESVRFSVQPWPKHFSFFAASPAGLLLLPPVCKKISVRNRRDFHAGRILHAVLRTIAHLAWPVVLWTALSGGAGSVADAAVRNLAGTGAPGRLVRASDARHCREVH